MPRHTRRPAPTPTPTPTPTPVPTIVQPVVVQGDFCVNTTFPNFNNYGTLTLKAPVGAGNTIALCVRRGAGTPVESIIDDDANLYSGPYAPVTNNASITVEWWLACNVVGGVKNITVTCTGASSPPLFVADEIRGLGTNPRIAQFVGIFGTQDVAPFGALTVTPTAQARMLLGMATIDNHELVGARPPFVNDAVPGPFYPIINGVNGVGVSPTIGLAHNNDLAIVPVTVVWDEYADSVDGARWLASIIELVAA